MHMSIRLLLSLLSFSLLLACSPVRVTSTWRSADAIPQAYGKLMVIGVIREADRSLREKMEQHLVDDLRAKGYPAFSAYGTFGPKGLEGLNEEQAYAKLRAEGVDGVLTAVLLDKKKEEYYVPGRREQYISFRRTFWGYYRNVVESVSTEGYYQATTRYFWESNLYDLTKKTLVYSVQTQATDPESANNMAHRYSQTIIEDMMKKGVLSKAGAEAAAKAY